MTHPYFAEPNVAALCAEIFHAVQSQLSQISRVLATARNQWEGNVAGRIICVSGDE